MNAVSALIFGTIMIIALYPTAIILSWIYDPEKPENYLADRILTFKEKGGLVSYFLTCTNAITEEESDNIVRLWQPAGIFTKCYWVKHGFDPDIHKKIRRVKVKARTRRGIAKKLIRYMNQCHDDYSGFYHGSLNYTFSCYKESFLIHEVMCLQSTLQDQRIKDAVQTYLDNRDTFISNAFYNENRSKRLCGKDRESVSMLCMNLTQAVSTILRNATDSSSSEAEESIRTIALSYDKMTENIDQDFELRELIDDSEKKFRSEIIQIQNMNTVQLEEPTMLLVSALKEKIKKFAWPEKNDPLSGESWNYPKA